jgi:hypothetical protein
MEGQHCRLKCETFFSPVIHFKEKKNDVTAWNISSSYCAFLDFFNIESRGAIVDEAPKAKVDSFSCFLMIRIFFSLQSTSLSILEQELVHSAAFFSTFHPDIVSSIVAIYYILQDSAGKLEVILGQIINEKELVSTSVFWSDKKLTKMHHCSGSLQPAGTR